MDDGIHARPLEPIGQLVGGIAHELSTPAQYVADNVEFLSRAFERAFDLIGACREVLDEARVGMPSAEALARAETRFAGARIDYLKKEAPRAIEQSFEGLRRVATLAAAMKALAHPDVAVRAPLDLNAAVGAVVTAATNEWKYVAEIEMSLDPDLPLLPCIRGELNQVLLALVVNAVRSVEALGTSKDTRAKARIRIETCHHDGMAEVRVSVASATVPRGPWIRSVVRLPVNVNEERPSLDAPMRQLA